MLDGDMECLLMIYTRTGRLAPYPLTRELTSRLLDPVQGKIC